jgi:light-regulated signal transduction histidine kinase (bacteriophytochrome)
VQRVADGELGTRVDGGNLPETIALAESFNDMTERLQHAREALDEQRRRVEEHAAALERSNADLEQFAYAAAHDLQEPLRTVASYTELLARRYRGRLDDDADEFIEFAVQGATRMQELIRALLAYSRVNTRTNEPEPVAIGDVLDDVERSLGAAIEDAGARIERDPDLPTVWGDRVQLEMALQNLVANGIKFRGEAPPVVRVTAHEVPGDPQLVELAVTDNGIGIEPQYRERVFRLFQRLNRRDDYEGTGIGLTLVRRIAERHGGTVSIDDAPGGGTRIAFTVPAGPARGSAPRDSSPDPAAPTHDDEGTSRP